MRRLEEGEDQLVVTGKGAREWWMECDVMNVMTRDYASRTKRKSAGD